MTALEGTTALVTGASSGIGASFARLLAQRGAAKIILVARREERLQALADELGACATVHVADLSDADQVSKLVAEHPNVDILINNAGIGWGAPLLEQRVDRLGEMIDLNCRSLMQLTHAVSPGMVERGRGWILNVGSTAGVCLLYTSPSPRDRG